MGKNTRRNKKRKPQGKRKRKPQGKRKRQDDDIPFLRQDDDYDIPVVQEDTPVVVQDDCVDATSSLADGDTIQGEPGRYSHSITPPPPKELSEHGLLLSILQAFGCLLVEKFIELTKPIYIVSVPPPRGRCTEQYAHADQPFPPENWTGKKININISGIFAFQPTYLYYWQHSATIGTEEENQHQTYEKKCIFLERGEFCIFLGNLIHAGYDYEEINARIHVYFELPLTVSSSITHGKPFFYNIKSQQLYEKFTGAKPNEDNKKQSRKKQKTM